jgi:hypothetical protein
LLGTVYHGIRAMYRTFGRIPPWRLGGAAWRSAAVVGLLAAGLWLVLNFRLEQRAEVAFQLEAVGATPVFSPLPGQLVDGVEYGHKVRRGNRVAQLRDQELQLKLETLTGRLNEIQAQLATMTIQAQQFPVLFAEIATLRTLHADLHRQQETLRDEQQRLTICAPADGLVLRAPSKYAGPDSNTLELRQWTGAPLDRLNRGCYLNSGDLVCLVGDPLQLQAVAQVDAESVGLMTVGNSVRMKIHQNAGETIRGQVVEIGLSDVRVPEMNSEHYQAANFRNAVFTTGFSPAQYYVRIKLENHPTWVRHGSGGVARIVTGHQTVAQMIQRFCRRVFRFHV